MLRKLVGFKNSVRGTHVAHWPVVTPLCFRE